MLIHELQTQNTTAVTIQNAEVVPRGFTSIQAQNKIFIVGGELKENEIRTVVANATLVLNELTY